MKEKSVSALELVKLCCRALEEKKAVDLRVLDVSEQSSITDYLVIATGSSEPHLRALRVELEKAIDASKRIQIRLRTGFRPNCQTRASSCTPPNHRAIMVSNDLKVPNTPLRNWLP